jgi:putative ABC transport system substrate-binding protein
LTAKRAELLNELIPQPVPLAVLVNSSNPVIDDQMRTTGRDLIVVSAATKSDIENAFETMVRRQTGGLIVWQEAYFTSERTLIVTLAQRHAIPAVYGPRLFTEIGGLMSYGDDRNELTRLTGTYAAKILFDLGRPSGLVAPGAIEPKLTVPKLWAQT